MLVNYNLGETHAFFTTTITETTILTMHYVTLGSFSIMALLQTAFAIESIKKTSPLYPW